MFTQSKEMPKTKKQSRRSRRKTFKRKSRRGGYESYKALKEYLQDKNNRTFDGIQYALDNLKGRESFMMRYIKFWRDDIVQWDDAKKRNPEYIEDTIEDIINILDHLIKRQERERTGGSIPTNAIKVSVPEPSNKIV